MSPLQKLLLVARQPHHLSGFAQFQVSRLIHNGAAQIHLNGGVRLAGYRRYSEWQSAKDFISPDEYALIRGLPLAEGDILDVGGNVGAFSLLLKKLHPARRVHCFEPVPDNFARLQQNLQDNRVSQVTAVQAAVTATSGQAAFCICPQSSAKCRLSDGSGDGIQVPAWSLDDYCQTQQVEKVSLLKVDVEGYEEDVFNGATRLLKSKMVACVYYEVCPELGRILNRNILAPTRLLEKYGYRIFNIGAQGALVDLDATAVSSAKLINLFAAAPEFCKELLHRVPSKDQF